MATIIRGFFITSGSWLFSNIFSVWVKKITFMCPEVGDGRKYIKGNKSKTFFLIFQRFDRRRIWVLNWSFQFPLRLSQSKRWTEMRPPDNSVQELTPTVSHSLLYPPSQNVPGDNYPGEVKLSGLLAVSGHINTCQVPWLSWSTNCIMTPQGKGPFVLILKYPMCPTSSEFIAGVWTQPSALRQS